jgi:hypothetical protein
MSRESVWRFERVTALPEWYRQTHIGAMGNVPDDRETKRSVLLFQSKRTLCRALTTPNATALSMLVVLAKESKQATCVVGHHARRILVHAWAPASLEVAHSIGT